MLGNIERLREFSRWLDGIYATENVSGEDTSYIIHNYPPVEGMNSVGDEIRSLADKIEREHAQRVAGLTGDLCSYEWRNKELKDALKAVCNRFGVSSTKWSAEDAAKKVLEALERDYMELPVDADGVPIHVGNLIEFGDKGERLEVTHIGWTKHGDPTIAYRRPNGTLDCSCIGTECRHVKPRTLEDVLREFTDEVIEWSGYSVPVSGDKTWSDMAAKYADEIRELLGGDAK